MEGVTNEDPSRGVGGQLRAAVSVTGTYLTTFSMTFVALNVVALWTVLWGSLARIHYLKGNRFEAGLTLVVLLIPIVAVLLYSLRNSLDRADMFGGQTTRISRS